MDNELLLSTEDVSNKKFRNKMKTFLVTTIIFFIISIIFISLYIYEKTNDDDKDNKNNKDKKSEDILTLWKENESKLKLINYIKTITKEGSNDFIKKEDRIAVFDFDGTLFQETDPIYTDYKLFKYNFR